MEPTKEAKRFTKLMLSFTVGVGVALAPYLGAVDVPGFTALYSIVPVDIRNVALPLSSAVCGIAALYTVTIWIRTTPNREMRRWFRRWVIVALASLVLFIATSIWFVVPVTLGGGTREVRFTVGPRPRPTRAPCPATMSDDKCIAQLSFDPAEIRSFWGDRSVRAGQALVLAFYVTFVGCLGAAIGHTMGLTAAALPAPPRKKSPRKRVADPAAP